ncbi:hypothetical protein CPLU01_08119 [Colletotrichum plurivorum]|uniref:Uncharacterized protein n=1 Tax=Colletotrichum plurivorum TaxID=2175906 RepID=A0A8H6KE61_9PEZI|nr:hypothetical protein CPLU01_08119 [Colletotrichum plurivorum]
MERARRTPQYAHVQSHQPERAEIQTAQLRLRPASASPVYDYVVEQKSLASIRQLNFPPAPRPSEVWNRKCPWGESECSRLCFPGSHSANKQPQSQGTADPSESHSAAAFRFPTPGSEDPSSVVFQI